MRVSGFIEDLWKSERDATDAEIRRLRQHVAQAGFDPDARERVRGRGAGIVWRGRTLRGRDTLPPAEAHYVRHVLAQPEWPLGTTLDDYLESLRHVITDDATGVFLSRYQARIQVGFVGRSGRWLGPEGDDWILVEFRQHTDHIVTAYQVVSPDAVAAQPERSTTRWLRNPR